MVYKVFSKMSSSDVDRVFFIIQLILNNEEEGGDSFWHGVKCVKFVWIDRS